MKQNEPLKDKVIECDNGHYDENDECVIINGKRRTYKEEDVASAVEWLKREIDKLDKDFIFLENSEKKVILSLIDKAFEDVVRKDED